MLMAFFSKYMKKQSNHLEIRRTKAGKTALQKLELAEQTIKAKRFKVLHLSKSGTDQLYLRQFQYRTSRPQCFNYSVIAVREWFCCRRCRNFVKPIQTCEFAQYAPSAETQRIELLSDARKSINTIQQGIKK